MEIYVSLPVRVLCTAINQDIEMIIFHPKIPRTYTKILEHTCTHTLELPAQEKSSNSMLFQYRGT